MAIYSADITQSFTREVLADPSSILSRCVCPANPTILCGCAASPFPAGIDTNVTQLLGREPPKLDRTSPLQPIILPVSREVDLERREAPKLDRTSPLQPITLPVSREVDGNLVTRCVCSAAEACGCVQTIADLDPALFNSTNSL